MDGVVELVVHLIVHTKWRVLCVVLLTQLHFVKQMQCAMLSENVLLPILYCHRPLLVEQLLTHAMSLRNAMACQLNVLLICANLKVNHVQAQAEQESVDLIHV